MSVDTSLEVEPARMVAYTDFGSPGYPAVVWCHGGPGCRLDPAYVAPDAEAAGLRVIGIDRPGYGRSTVLPGRTIEGWTADAVAVADHLGIDTFATVGLSTGGSPALAVAAGMPGRVVAAVACAAITDMRFEPARETMSRPHALAVWDAPDRAQALEAAVASHGIDGSQIVASAEGPPLCASDLTMLAGPWGQRWMEARPEMFAQGLEGYVDDRIADRDGWVGFDVTSITCPVVVLHGTDDVIADPIHARHTASRVPTAALRLVPGAGHFSIEDHLVDILVDLLAPPG